MNHHVGAVALSSAAAHPSRQFSSFSFAGLWLSLSHHPRPQLQAGLALRSPINQKFYFCTEAIVVESKRDASEALPQLQHRPVLISKEPITPLPHPSHDNPQQPTLVSQNVPNLSWMSSHISDSTGASHSADVQTTLNQGHLLRDSNSRTKSYSGSIQGRFFAKLEADKRFNSSHQTTLQDHREEDCVPPVQSCPSSAPLTLQVVPTLLDHPSEECNSLSQEPLHDFSTETEAGKIFVGNLPYFLKKESIVDFFGQFGKISNVIMIKNHENITKNMGYCFILYGGSDPVASALKATEYNGVEFYGKSLRVRLDDGRRLKGIKEERENWIEGINERNFRSDWHEEREKNSIEFLRVLENYPQNWQRVIRAFYKIEKPRQRDFSLLVGYYAKHGDKHNAHSAFESMRSVGIQPNVYIYTNLVHAYAMARDMRGAIGCIEDMHIDGVCPNQATYIVFSFRDTEERGRTKTWFQKLKSSNLPLNSIIYNNIINAHCKAGNMRRVETLVLEMEGAGFEETLGLYNCVMDGYAHACEEKNCLMIFCRLKEAGMLPNAVSYGCLINLYTKLGKIGKAIAISKEMQAHGIPHNKKTYSMLIDGYVQLEDSASAFSVFEDLMKEGLKPDVVTYNILINAFCKTKHMERAFGLLNRMKKEGQRPTFQTYTTIIDGFIRARDMKMALEMVQQMKKAGCKPSAATYNVMMYGLVQEGQIDRAIAIIDEMVLAGITPTERSYTILMEGYACIGKVGTAFKFLMKMKEEGLKADIVSYGSLLKSCCKAGRMQSALAVLNEMNSAGVERNVFIYNILLDGWAQRGDMWEAAEVLHWMCKEGLCPDIYTYTSFINACCKAGDMKKAMETVADMKNAGVEPNIKTYTTLVHGWASVSFPEKALACYRDMKEAGLKPDIAICHCLMTSLLSRADVARDTVFTEIKGLVSQMIVQGVCIDLATAKHWQKFLYKAKTNSGELTELVQKLYPPDWVGLASKQIDSLNE